MKYYLHDSTAFEDEKVTELFINFGYEGLGLFYTLLEKLALQEKPVKTLVLKQQLKVGKRLEKCWSFMESLGLIHSNNGETFNKQLLNFSEKYQIKKEKNAKRISEWREKQEHTENVTSYESVRNTPKDKISKVNRSKVKEYSDVIYFDNQFLNRKFNDFLENRIKIKKPATEKAIELLIKKLNTFPDDDYRIEAIENAIITNWSGIFPLKINGKPPPQKIDKLQQVINAHDEVEKIINPNGNTFNLSVQGEGMAARIVVNPDKQLSE